MFGMNPVQFDKLLRQLLSVGSVIAATLGWTWFDGLAGTILAVIGPAGALISMVWSLASGTNASVVSAAIAIPNVKAIVLDGTVPGTAAINRATPNSVTVAP